MSTFDPYLGSLIKPSNVKTHLYDYILNRLGVGPTAPQITVPDTPYKSTTGKYVGTDTSKVGGNNRNIDLEKSDLHSQYVGVNPDTQNVIERDGQMYIIDKDKKIAGKTVVDDDAPTGLGRVGAGIRDALDWINPWGVDQDRDKRGGWGTQDDVLVNQLPKTRLKSPAELEIDQDLAKEGHYDRKNDKALDRAMKTAEHQSAVDLNYMKQMYPIAQAAAWDATNRALYGDKYSTSAAQRRMAESAGAEALMYGAVAQQANAAANMRPRFAGKNLSIG